MIENEESKEVPEHKSSVGEESYNSSQFDKSPNAKVTSPLATTKRVLAFYP